MQSGVLLPEEEHSVLSAISNPEEKRNTFNSREAKQSKGKAHSQVNSPEGSQEQTHSFHHPQEI